MSVQESTVKTAMEAMPQNINDRLTRSMDTFYRDELEQSPAKKVSGWPSLDIFTRFKIYKENEYEAWERECEVYEERHAEEKRRREAERAQSKRGFFGGLGDFLGDAARGIGHAISSPTQPEQLSDDEALQDINLAQRYLRSVTLPGMKPLNLPPTVGRALKDFDTESLNSTIVYNYLLKEWERRGVEEIVGTSNERIFRDFAQNPAYNIITDDEQNRRKDIKIIMQYLRQVNNQHHSKNKGKRLY
jgi:hypothetical protein